MYMYAINNRQISLTSVVCVLVKHVFVSLLSIQKYVKEQVLHVVAIICKRGILENSLTTQESLLRDVTQLVSSNNREMVSTISYLSITKGPQKLL